jgi:hypothetical protein
MRRMIAMCSPENLDSFIRRWEDSGAGERANAQLFLSELCDLLDLPHPDPARPETAENAYVFERAVTFQNGDGTTAPGRIDLYKRGCFVLEAKQGADGEAVRTGTGRRGTPGWDQAMLRARAQAERYIRALPSAEGRPPFLVTTDVGHVIELFAEFSQTGGSYIPFPAPGAHRISMADLRKPEIRDRLTAVWSDPLSLDPARRTARVTRAIAGSLARLAVSLEKRGEDPATVAAFLMRCLFTMFAEDVSLIGVTGHKPWTRLLEDVRETPEAFVHMVSELWAKMNTGGFSTSVRLNILKFNGGLFADNTVLPVDSKQIALLLEASRHDWRDVEPAIFGTLLERALDPIERHKLGAHYTPRAYVERLVMPVIINPVREEWLSVQAAAMKLDGDGNRKAAVRELREFLRRLCHIRVLDPACGSGNFLYVTLEHLKRIEGEVLDTLNGFGEKQIGLEMAGETVDPHQLLGLEVNPRAAAIAELVLWIGTLQWHFRNRGSVMPPQPIIRDFRNIECRDALIDYDAVETVLDADGRPVTHWDGRTTKPHPVTGKEVPDETARLPEYRYCNPRKAVWPEADYIVGNPPFIGASRMRDALGDGYTETVRQIHSDIAESSDFVMYWWNHAAELVAQGKVRRFGFITTNSLKQTFNRRVLEKHLEKTEDRRLKTEDRETNAQHPTPNAQRPPTKNEAPRTKNQEHHPVSLHFAIPDHPWVDDGAAVRIAMTVLAPGDTPGLLQTVITEHDEGTDGYSVELQSKSGKICADLTIGADVPSCGKLKANHGVSNPGVKLHGAGFIVTRDEAQKLGLGRMPGTEKIIREYRNGKDLTNKSRDVMVIDLFGLSTEKVLTQYPEIYQRIVELVKPERDQNKRASRKEYWWLFGETNPKLRDQLSGLSRYIATVETSKYRFFVFLDASILPDNMLVNIASDDPFVLGVLSSHLHVCWALATGAILGPTPRYNKTRCFETFPFPDATPEQQARIRELAEQLDAHRKRQQSQHPDLTMTGMYNVLEKLRSGAPLAAKDKTIHEQGLVSVLKQLHDDLDRAVAAAYGWPDLGPQSPSSALGPQSPSSATLEERILERLVALNHQRAAEEAQGQIRYLRPAYQNPGSVKATQSQLDIETETPETARRSPLTANRQPPTAHPWPATLPEQMRALTAHIQTAGIPLDLASITKAFKGARKPKVQEILEALTDLGRLTKPDDGHWQG